MKICIPTNTSLGLQSEVAANFGEAPWLLIVDSDTCAITPVHAADPEQRAGPITMDLIMCRGMTERLYELLKAQGVPIYGTRAKSVAEVLEDYREGSLCDLADANCCRGTRPDCDNAHTEAGET